MKNKKYILIFFSISVVLLFSACGSSVDTNTKTNTDTSSVKTPAELILLNTEIANSPNNAALYSKRAKYYYETNNLGAGIQDIEKAIFIDSTKADYYFTASNFYFSVNKTGLAKNALEKCIALDDKNVEALLKLAELYLYVTKFDKSIEIVNKVLKLDEYNATAYFMKGMCYKELKDTARAISSMKTAVEQEKNYYHAYMQLGLLYAAIKNKIAIEYYKNAIQIQPQSTEAWYALSKFYQDNNDWDNAIAAYEELIKFDVHNKFAHHNLGVIYLTALKLNESALKSFSNAINSDPKYVDAYYGRGLTYQSIGDKKNARIDFESCLAIDPNYSSAQEALRKVVK